MPDQDNLRWCLVRAGQTMLRKSWTPPQPANVLSLAGDLRRRLVEGGEQLQDVVDESLARWEAELQGTPPTAFGLWDEVSPGKHKPKGEEKMSDALAAFLKKDLAGRGIVINREVVIRRGEKPGGRGERTDILVDAIARGDSADAIDVITVTVEVKGCWNR